MECKPSITIAMQRSGTKFFGSCLNAGEKVWSFGEVMHHEGRKEESSLSYYCEQVGRHAFGATYNELMDILDGFFDYLASLKRNRDPHIDIMYNNLGALVPIWSYPTGIEPIFLSEYVKSRGVNVIHIVRESVLDAYVSLMVADARGIYHSDSDDVAQEPINISIDIGDFRRFVVNNIKTRELVRSNFSNYDRYIEIKYPEFGVDNSIDVRHADFSRLFGDLRGIFGPSCLRKTTNKNVVNIVNMNEVHRAYEDVRFCLNFM